MNITLRRGFDKCVAWGKPDSPPRRLCYVCFAPLPPVPLMVCRSDGYVASLCDRCVAKWVEAK